jgi:hypothetical protein
MAKKPALNLTAAEINEGVAFIRRQFGDGRLGKKFSRLSAAKQREYAAKFLRKHARRKADGSIDFNALLAFIKELLALLLPLFVT